MTDIASFVKVWNSSHKKDVIFYLLETDDGDPISINIRYVAVKYHNYTHMNWERFNFTVNTKSHGTMFPNTGEDLFARGIIDLSIACKNHTYKEANIVSTLEWIGEKFFPSLLLVEEQP